jgi:hypothetical protein
MKAYEATITKAEFVRELKKHQKADDSVKRVRADLEAKGFTVTGHRDVSANGPDLTAIRGDVGFTVEVKSAFFTKRAWKIQPAKRVHDDFIAVVFPNGAIHYETMKQHQDMVGTRSRCLTSIARICGN